MVFEMHRQSPLARDKKPFIAAKNLQKINRKQKQKKKNTKLLLSIYNHKQFITIKTSTYTCHQLNNQPDIESY